MDTHQLFDAVLQLLDREDQLTNSRMTWYLTIQGFIIAGVSLIFISKVDLYENLQKPAIVLLSFLAAAISIIVLISVLRARKAKKEVREKWDNYISDDKDSYPNPLGDTSSWSFATPGQSVPVILLVFWAFIIIGAFLYI